MTDEVISIVTGNNWTMKFSAEVFEQDLDRGGNEVV